MRKLPLLPLFAFGIWSCDQVTQPAPETQLPVVQLDEVSKGAESNVTESTTAAIESNGCTATDAYGYQACAVPYEFEDISDYGHPFLSGADDSFECIDAGPAGFEFELYGTTYSSSICFSSNGLITFPSGTTEYSNTDLTISPYQAAIAPFWDDLVVESIYGMSHVFWLRLGSGAYQRLIIQWNDVQFYRPHSSGSTDLMTFQAVLFADGTMQFNYLDLVNDHGNDEGRSATVGIKDAGTQGPYRLLVSYNAGPNAFVGSGQSTRILIVNLPPDCSGAAPSLDVLWPANHQFVPIDVLGVIDPEGDPVTLTIDGIWQDEPTDTYGDGRFTPDGMGVGTPTAEVRAERAGTKKVPGNGRVYHIFFTATDPAGAACSGEVMVGVPHDQKGDPAVDDGPLYDSTLP